VIFQDKAQLIDFEVHNLIAQEDNMRNIELARDSKVIATASKRDSSIMKILAVLGTLFLPASFIAVGTVVHNLCALTTK
jgi:Mg2+ and Co2+ transporter CorA